MTTVFTSLENTSSVPRLVSPAEVPTGCVLTEQEQCSTSTLERLFSLSPLGYETQRLERFQGLAYPDVETSHLESYDLTGGAEREREDDCISILGLSQSSV